MFYGLFPYCLEGQKKIGTHKEEPFVTADLGGKPSAKKAKGSLLSQGQSANVFLRLLEMIDRNFEQKSILFLP